MLSQLPSARARAVAGDGDERELALVDGGHRELVAEAGAARERAVTVQAEAVAVARERQVGAAARVLDAAPEEALLAVAARQLVGLLGGAEQRRDPGLREVVADQVGDRRVAAGDASGDLRGLGEVEALAAVGDGLLDLQEVELAEQLDLRPGVRFARSRAAAVARSSSATRSTVASSSSKEGARWVSVSTVI